MDAGRASLLDLDPSIAHAIGVRDAARLPPLPVLAVAAGQTLAHGARLVVAAGYMVRAGSLLGPGDLLDADGGWIAGVGARVAVLDRDAPGLAPRAARQAARREALRVATATAAPAEALLALLWWVAERWGGPSRGGIVLDLALDLYALEAVTLLHPDEVALALRALEGVVERPGGVWRLTSPETDADALHARRDALRLRVVEQLAIARASQRAFLAVYGQLAAGGR